MSAAEKFLLPNVQSIRDGRRIATKRVGVKGMLHPLTIRAVAGGWEQYTVAEAYMHIALPDEKYVTECAYEDPKLVEDLVRDIALRLNRDERVRAHVVESENFESIHNHSAHALVELDKDVQPQRSEAAS